MMMSTNNQVLCFLLPYIVLQFLYTGMILYEVARRSSSLITNTTYDCFTHVHGAWTPRLD